MTASTARLIACSVAAALVASVAQAAPATPAVTDSADPAAQMAAVAEADRLIAEADAGAFFVNTTGSGAPSVRHLRSGLTCTFGPEPAANKIVLFDAKVQRGDDVACRTREAGTVLTLYATLYPDPVHPETAIRNAIAEMWQVYKKVRPYSGTTSSVAPPDDKPDFPRRYVAYGEIDLQGVPHFTMVSTAEVRGWIFKLRATTPIAAAMEGQVMAELTLWSTLRSVLDTPGEISGPSAPSPLEAKPPKNPART